MRTLIINSYAGSLTIAATRLGLDVVGSYEDAKFGIDIQRANFPWLNFVPTIDRWPKQDLSDVFVVAHPPCSAFSVQNSVKTARGPNSKAFDCTKKVLRYAMDNGALGVAVESVMGALAGAWHVHQQFADDRGYHLYRILQNGCMFGTPQWRERFWAVWIKKGVVRDPTLRLTLTPRWETVQDTVEGYEDGPICGTVEGAIARQIQHLREKANCTDEDIEFFLNSTHTPTTPLGRLVWKRKFPERQQWEIYQDYILGFSSGQLVFLDPEGLAPTLMSGSMWWLNGRAVSEDAMKLIGGFPVDYEFPEYPRNTLKGMRMYISKGVIPAVAEWILWQIGEHLGWRWPSRQHAADAYRIEIQPDHIADFRISRQQWPWQKDSDDYGNVRPELRHFREDYQRAIDRKLKELTRAEATVSETDDASCTVETAAL